MPSTKGQPTNSQLYKDIKDGVLIERHSRDVMPTCIDVCYYLGIQKETNKDGSGKGQWSAWKV